MNPIAILIVVYKKSFRTNCKFFLAAITTVFFGGEGVVNQNIQYINEDFNQQSIL